MARIVRARTGPTSGFSTICNAYLALFIRSGSDLQRCIQDNVWSLWTQLFRELGIPCDDLAAPPAEIREALAQYQREEPTASAA